MGRRKNVDGVLGVWVCSCGARKVFMRKVVGDTSYWRFVKGEGVHKHIWVKGVQG